MLAREVFLVNLSCYYNVLLYDIIVTKRVIWSADNVKCLFKFNYGSKSQSNIQMSEFLYTL